MRVFITGIKALYQSNISGNHTMFAATGRGIYEDAGTAIVLELT
jgi:hypothetical protein